MTTTIKVMTHVWPAEVTRVDPETGEVLIAAEVVPPHTNLMFYVSNTQALVIKELPEPEQKLTPRPTAQQPEMVQ